MTRVGVNPNFQAANNNSSDNLKGLLGLRLVGIVSQVVAVIVAVNYLDMRLPLVPITGVISASLLLTLSSLFLLKTPQRINDTLFFLQLLFDVFTLTALLYLTGGATNAFAWFLLVPHTVASTLLSKPYAWFMGLLTSAAYTFIMFVYMPLIHKGHQMEMPIGGHFQEHIFGMWIGFILATFLIAYFIAGMADTLRRRNKLLADMREDVLRDERLVALGTLATGAAHELGTPLGTMDIVAHELELSFDESNNQGAKNKLHIIQEQIKRCKQTLFSITNEVNLERVDEGQVVPVDECISNVIKLWRVSHLDVLLTEKYEREQPAPALVVSAMFRHALINVLDNAAEASAEAVYITVDWDVIGITIIVEDEGSGMNAQRLQSLGGSLKSSKESGLGIGLYLTKASIERMGGEISWLNRDRGGVSVCIRLPLDSGGIK